MADREDQSNLPPIPDGGLAESMPDWLRRPPAWRTLPDREVAVPEPEETAALPEPDDSVIDPRTFLGDDDLPEWLRNLGPGRGPAASLEDAQNALEADMAPTGIDTRASDLPSEPAPARFVPASLPVTASSRSIGASRAPERPNVQPALATSGRQERGLVTLLAGLLVIATIVIIVLVVA
jgi:hypothetical protein